MQTRSQSGRDGAHIILALVRQRQKDVQVRGQPGLYSKYQYNQGYIKKLCLKKYK